MAGYGYSDTIASMDKICDQSFLEGLNLKFDTARDVFLGCGATAAVYRVVDTETGARYAAKFMQNNMANAWGVHMHEVAARRLEGRNVVPELHSCNGVGNDAGLLVVLMQLLDPLPSDVRGAAKYAAGMRRCVEELHKAGISHGDIHLDNFMVEPETDTVRLIDFNLAYDYNDPLIWFVPEIPRGKIYRDLDWSWTRSSRTKRGLDFLVDNVKLETTIDLLGL